MKDRTKSEKCTFSKENGENLTNKSLRKQSQGIMPAAFSNWTLLNLHKMQN